jgi:ATP12 chaperone protein
MWLSPSLLLQPSHSKRFFHAAAKSGARPGQFFP